MNIGFVTRSVPVNHACGQVQSIPLRLSCESSSSVTVAETILSRPK